MSRTIRHSNRTPDVQPVNEAPNEANPTAVAENQEIPPELPDWRDEYGFTPMENGENEWRLSVGKPPLRPSNPRSVEPDPTPQARPAAPEPLRVRKPVALVPADRSRDVAVHHLPIGPPCPLRCLDAACGRAEHEISCCH